MKLDLNDYFVIKFICVILKASTNHGPCARRWYKRFTDTKAYQPSQNLLSQTRKLKPPRLGGMPETREWGAWLRSKGGEAGGIGLERAEYPSLFSSTLLCSILDKDSNFRIPVFSWMSHLLFTLSCSDYDYSRYVSSFQVMWLIAQINQIVSCLLLFRQNYKAGC